MMKVGSLFSGGIDGMIMGFRWAGFKPAISIDIESSATKILQQNYNHRILTADIRETSWREFQDCEVLCITAPCQYYSVGQNMNRAKMADNETIQGRELYLQGFRMIAMVQPEVYIAENVPQFLNYKVPTECFTELRPYETFVIEADTKDFRLPQNRSRIFFLGFRRGWLLPRPPDPFQHQIYNRQLTVGDIKEHYPRIEIQNYVKKRIDGGYRDLPSIKTDRDLANTCVAHYGKDQSTTLVMDDYGYKGLRPFTVMEYKRLMGIPDNYDLSSVGRTTRYKFIGDSVSPLICRGLGLEIAKNKNCERKEGGAEHA